MHRRRLRRRGGWRGRRGGGGGGGRREAKYTGEEEKGDGGGGREERKLARAKRGVVRQEWPGRRRTRGRGPRAPTPPPVEPKQGGGNMAVGQSVSNRRAERSSYAESRVGTAPFCSVVDGTGALDIRQARAPRRPHSPMASRPPRAILEYLVVAAAVSRIRRTRLSLGREGRPVTTSEQ